MPKITLAGHPLHVILNDLPLGLLPFSLAMDVMHAVTGKRAYAESACHSLLAGYAGAWAAGAAGVADYLELPSGSHSKGIANLHAGLNLCLLGLTTVNLAVRRREHAGPLPLLLSSVGTAVLFTSAWYGGAPGLRARGARQRSQPGGERARGEIAGR